jgi:hypothetical protein
MRSNVMSLNEEEKKVISKAANKASKFVSGHDLEPKVHDQIFATVESFQGSKKPVVGKEAIALWAAKIDYAIANGDRPTVSKLITVPIGGTIRPDPLRADGFYDSNGGCSCNGGGTGPTSW